MNAVTTVTDKISELQPIYDRMDKTRKALTQPYVIVDFDNREIKAAKSVTLNTAKWQANTLSNKLLKLKWQTVVQGEGLSKTRVRDIERFSTAVWAQVDEHLANSTGISGGVMDFQSRQVIDTGVIGQRVYLYYKKGELIIDVRPLDMRWCPFEQNEWYCPIESWEASRLNTLLDGWRKGKDYEVMAGFEAEGAGLVCWEFWDADKMEFYVAQRKVAERKNPFDRAPFTVIKPATGHFFRDANGNTYDAVDALWLDIDLYETENLAASIAQTMAMSLILPKMVQPSNLENLTKPPDVPPMLDETTRVLKDEIPQPYGGDKDLNNAFLKLDQTITQAIQRGGVTDMEAGQSTAPNTALLVTTNTSITLEKLQPFIAALEALRTGSMRLILDQYSKLSKKNKEGNFNDFGITGMKHRFSPQQVGDPATYLLSYKAKFRTKEMELANRAEFLALYGRLPLRYNLEQVLEVEDADGIISELEQEKWKEADPTIGMVEGALKFAEEADELKGIDADIKFDAAKNLIEQAVLMRRQRRAAAQATASPLPEDIQNPALEPSKGNAQGLLGLGGLAGGGHVVARNKPLQLTGGR